MPDPGPKPARRFPRERRVDLLRGVALLTILIDHVPANVLGRFTLRNFGFSDAAELFVILAGFASMLAYGDTFARHGIGAGLWRLLGRVLRIYVFQVGLLLLTLGVLRIWLPHYGMEPNGLGPLIDQGLTGVRRSLALSYLPIYLDILPLYIVLLLMFPLIYVVMRRRPWAALFLSGLLWAVPNLDDGFNLTNGLNGMGWFFNPFAWQLVFVIGAAGAVLLRRCGGTLPRIGWARAVAWAFLAWAFLETFPWASWGLPSLAPLGLPPTDKSNLALLRLLHILALVYVALTSDVLLRMLRHPWVRAIEACGRHSLEVFALGTVLALFSRLVLRTYGVTWALELAVNVVGIAAMLLLAHVRDQARVRRAARMAQAPDVGAVPSELR